MTDTSGNRSEIDALLGGEAALSSVGDVAGVPAVDCDPAEAQVFDFRRPHRITREQMRALETMYERFTASLEEWINARARGGITLTLRGVEQVNFGEFVLSLPTPCASFTFEAREGGAQPGLMDFGHELAFLLVDRLFGGAGKPGFPSRALTPIERMAVRVVADRVLIALQEVWKEHIELDLAITGFEAIPESMRIAAAEDPVLVANVEAAAEGGETRSLITICLPFTLIESWIGASVGQRPDAFGSPAELANNRQQAEHSIRGSRLRIAARLPEFRISIRELLALTAGSVVATGLSRNVPLDVLIGDQPRFRATPGRVGPALALRLADGLLPAPETDTIPLHRA
ncbi:MAG: flagellar motor switch protein FliM [Gemmatimonadota bacterium]